MHTRNAKNEGLVSTAGDVTNKVSVWIEEISILSDIAKTQPHAALAAYIHGLIHNYTFLCRTTPNIHKLLIPLEGSIRTTLIPSICDRPAPNDLERDLLGLPPRLGGIGIANPVLTSDIDYSSSSEITQPLINLIQDQCWDYPVDCVEAQISARKEARRHRRDLVEKKADSIQHDAPLHLKRAMELAQEKGASSWLTTRPLKEHNFVLHKRALHDALALRYGWSFKDVPSHCTSGVTFSIEHELSCPRGGFTILRHNDIRDFTANVLSDVCHNVKSRTSPPTFVW